MEHISQDFSYCDRCLRLAVPPEISTQTSLRQMVHLNVYHGNWDHAFAFGEIKSPLLGKYFPNLSHSIGDSFPENTGAAIVYESYFRDVIAYNPSHICQNEVSRKFDYLISCKTDIKKSRSASAPRALNWEFVPYEHATVLPRANLFNIPIWF